MQARTAMRTPASWLRIVAIVGAVAAAAPLPRFDAVFATAGESSTIHYQATYLAGAVPHTLEVWRDHDRRVKRVTDGTIMTVATHTPGDPEFSMTVVDPVKRVITTIDRTNLYRLGNFTDWFDLTHGLRHPRGGYGLAAGSALSGTPAASGRCAWYDLTAGAATTHICWSAAERLPLVIVAGDGRVVWRIVKIDHAPLAADVFRIADRGFVHVDTNRDLDRD